MSWAAKRRMMYALGVFLFFLITVGGPIAYYILSVPPTCSDGIQNQKETAVDEGGPCRALDEHSLQQEILLWARSFHVRDGSYNAIAFVQNPNTNAGVRAVQYQFGLYDERNILIAERNGTTVLMPGQVTPIFEGAIDTGNRIVSHTYFDFTEPLKWERLYDTSGAISINNVQIADVSTQPRVTANVTNTSVAEMTNLTFLVAVYDPAGNAFAASQTAIESITPGETQRLIFTWPDTFNITVGRIQIVPLTVPSLNPSR